MTLTDKLIALAREIAIAGRPDFATRACEIAHEFGGIERFANEVARDAAEDERMRAAREAQIITAIWQEPLIEASDNVVRIRRRGVSMAWAGGIGA